MPGWRMAMLASNAQFVQWILKVKSNIDSGQFKPMQYAAVEALSAKKEWYDNMNRVYRSRRDLAGQIMRTLGCEYDENQVGMFLWGRIPDSAESGEAIANKVLYEARIYADLSSVVVASVISVSPYKNETLEEALKKVRIYN